MNIIIDFLEEHGAEEMQAIRESDDERQTVKNLNSPLELICEGNLSDKGERVVEFANDNHNPSARKGCKKYNNFETLKNCEWVCGECELEGSQTAAYIRNYRNHGFIFDSRSGMGDTARMSCENCGEKTTHRRMKYPFPVEEESLREDMPKEFTKRVKQVHNNREAIEDEKKSPDDLEVDHRVPRIRQDDSEYIDFGSITDAEIKERYQLLSQTNNCRKSRACERCKETGCRQSPVGTDHFYKGGREYTKELGCEGCFYYNPDEWRQSFCNNSVQADNIKSQANILTRFKSIVLAKTSGISVIP